MSTFASKKSFVPKKIYVEESVASTPLSKRIIRHAPHSQVDVIADAQVLLEKAASSLNKGSWQNNLLLAKQRGPFLRRCPGTPKYLCCLYYNLDVAAGCDLGCTYCILQGYLNNPLITIHCNTEEMYHELDSTLRKNSRIFYRIGTGELSDSLTFEHLTELGPELVTFFADKRNAIIELKSKNVHIDALLGLDHRGRTVVSWSLNTIEMQKSEEPLATTIDDRLYAARAVQNAGYKIGFHFDPMIDHPGWHEGYRDIVDKIFRFIKPENIVWISLGALRYPAPFEHILRENHPDSRIFLGELLPGIDKKLRYFKPIRIDLFGSMVKWIRSYSKEVFVYLCMESADVWRKAFGWAPRSSAHLKQLLDDRVKP
ncbi:hypothetical protein JXA70_08755 [candidate division KSB1 bacterium]|nr:hypothetical protein [candidate division KSB1 bacterium]